MAKRGKTGENYAKKQKNMRFSRRKTHKKGYFTCGVAFIAPQYLVVRRLPTFCKILRLRLSFP